VTVNCNKPRSFIRCENKWVKKKHCCQWRAFFANVAVTWCISLWCRKGKAFCERLFALHRQQPEKDKQNVDCDPPWGKFLRTPMAAILTVVPIPTHSAIHNIILKKQKSLPLSLLRLYSTIYVIYLLKYSSQRLNVTLVVTFIHVATFHPSANFIRQTLFHL